MAKRWKAQIVLALGTLLAAGAVSHAAVADLTAEESEALTGPLDPSDPRAQTEPALLEAPDMQPPPPEGRRVNRRRAQVGIEHDMVTGKTKRSRRGRARPDNEPSSPEYAGQIVTEPGEIQPELTHDLAPSTGQPQVVWGTDNRVRITPTTSFPWRAHTKLVMTFPNGKVAGCSGTLIAAKYVLTAGHCVHSSENGGWATRIEVIPGYDDGYRPYGTAYATYLRSDTGWTTYRLPEYDFALVTLDRSVGNSTGWFGFTSLGDLTLYSHTANLSGYPSDLCGGRCQYYDSDPISWVLVTTIYYNTDSYKGHSGSSVYSFVNGSRSVLAVHRGECAGRVDKNCGVRITSDRASRIRGWITSGY